MDKHQTKRTRIGILTFPIGKAGCISTSNLVEVLYSISKDIYLITGNEGYAFFKNDKRLHVYGIFHKTGSNSFSRIIKFVITQLKLSYNLIRVIKKMDILFFTLGSDMLIIPVITAKLFRKKVVLGIEGSTFLSFKNSKGKYLKIVKIISKINFMLSTEIIIFSDSLLEEFNLKNYKEKILIAPRHFVDLDKFKITKKLSDRDNLIGYVGRFSEEKGFFNFVRAIPVIQKNRPNLDFLICGDGPLKNDILKYLSDNNLNHKVKIQEWIPHNELPKYLNELKLIIIPSYTETGPMILFESMACGVPSIATLVGSVHDLIQDGETGFIMENNSPECIAKNVDRAFRHQNLEKLVLNARSVIEQEFTYEVAVGRYKKILSELLEPPK